jgi:hypothetical protein
MAFLTLPVLLSAAASGLAVVLVTWIADRAGGTIGGLLATAPVTTAAAILYLTSELGNEAIGVELLHGGKSLFAAIAAMPLYFYLQKFTTRPVPLWVRIIGGMLIYVGTFTGLTLLADKVTPTGWEAMWIPLTLLLVFVATRTYMRDRIPSRLLRGAKPPLTFLEAGFRFLAGALIIVLVTWLRDTDPLLTTAWAVFPGTFIVSLGVLGFGHGAAFSARVAQGGALGGPPIIAYILVLWGLLPLLDATWWAWAVQLPAWGAYFVVLYPLWKWQNRRREEPVAAAPAVNP